MLVRRLLVASVGFWGLSCGGAPDADHPRGQARPSLAVCLPEPVPSASPRFVASKSRVAAVVELSDRTLQTLVDETLPTTVARGDKVKAGIAGRASYEIKRYDIALAAGSDGLRLTTPLRGDIQLCKPFGAVCFGYGRCYPEWDATLTLPPDVTRANTPHIDFGLELRKGCLLSPVRFDATSELQKITEQQERKIEEQVNQTVSKHYKRLLESLKHGFGAGKLPSGECVSFAPDDGQIAVKTGRADDKIKHMFAAGLVGTTALGCEPTKLEPAFRVRISESIPTETLLVVEQLLPLSTIERTWADVDSGVRVSVRSSGSEVVVHLAPFGSCGTAWGRFVPETTPSGVKLRPVQTSDQTLETWVAQRGPLFATQMLRHSAAVQEVSRYFNGPIEVDSPLANDWGLELSGTSSQSVGVRVVDQGIVLVGQLQGHIRGRVHKRRD